MSATSAGFRRDARNKRNGTTPKTVLSEVGPVPLDVPRDRNSTFEPRLVPKGARRIGGGLDEMIISLYAGGMTVRDIQHHLARTLGTELSHETISKITDGVAEEVKAWQHRAAGPGLADRLRRRPGGEGPRRQRGPGSKPIQGKRSPPHIGTIVIVPTSEQRRLFRPWDCSDLGVDRPVR